MPRTRDIAVIVGSLRRDSLNRKAALELKALAPEHLKLEIVEIGALPLYNEDLDGEDCPAEWRAFRERVGRADAVLFVTPEYNRTIPAPMKNAIDVGSRPYGKAAWTGKPAAVISVSPGAYGGFGANHHLRQSAVFLDMPMMQQPEAYVGSAGAIFGDDGKLADARASKLLARFIRSYAGWIEHFLPPAGEAD